MADIISFEKFKERKLVDSFEEDDVPMLPFQEPEDMPIFNKIKSRVWVIVWYIYIQDLVKVAIWWKNIINRLHINSDNIPYNIVAHLKQTTIEERKKLWSEISEALKKAKKTFIKEQLFFLRTKILQTLN